MIKPRITTPEDRARLREIAIEVLRRTRKEKKSKLDKHTKPEQVD